MPKKYIYACIRLPMEVCPDGRYEPCNEYTEVSFEKCDKLPEKSSTGNYNLDAILSAFNRENPELEEDDEEEEAEVPNIVLTKDEIKTNNKHKKNRTTTFKNRKGIANRYSTKNRKSIELDVGDIRKTREGCGLRLWRS